MRYLNFIGLFLLLMPCEHVMAECSFSAVIRPLFAFRSDNLGVFKKRIFRAKDGMDVHLMRESYLRSSATGPVEMGVIELLDKKGHIIDSVIAHGAYGSIDSMNSLARSMLLSHASASDIKFVQMRHTHPREFASSKVMAVETKFSAGDLRQDLIFTEYLKSQPKLKHIQLKSWIIYIRPGVDDLLYGSQVLKSQLGIRGYIP